MRSCGILMHISSLPSPYGVGTLGKEAYHFVDFLEKAGQSYWQTLPICPTSYGDSPYQSYSTYAGNPYFIDLDILAEKGLLMEEEYKDIDWGSEADRVNYGVLYEKRFPVLKIAARRFGKQMESGKLKQAAGYRDFCEKNAFWLNDYALYMTLKEMHGGRAWMDWDLQYRNRQPEAMEKVGLEHKEDLDFWKIIQFLFFDQWHDLHDYCRSKKIQIIGDLPFYVAMDSVDVWAHPDLFLLDENHDPIEIAGVPPDGFSADGQLWGNPVYNWEEHRRTGYKWWIQKIDTLCQQYDILRIDHFRGFDSYYTVPRGAITARGGKWNPGPGAELFLALEEAVGKRQIIAEDLGYTTESVKQLLAVTGFPGMKILQFGFDERDQSSLDHRPHLYPVHCLAYTGTHDNDTLQGWMQHASPENVALAKDYLRLHDPDQYHWDMIKALYATAAETAIVQAQDLLGLGSDCRMNVPSTMGGNWCWRAGKGDFDDELADKLLHISRLYDRSRQMPDNGRSESDE